MKELSPTVLLLVLIPFTTHAQTLSCSTSPVDKHFGKKRLWDGYAVSVSSTEHFVEDSGAEDACTAAIYDSAGKEVYRTTGPGVRLDPATGMDIDGDGSPDVVLMNGASGGSGGSWQIEVISLKPQPHLLSAFEVEFPPAPFETDSRNRVVLWSEETVNELSLEYGWPNSARPKAQTVYRWVGGKFTDVTSEYCDEIEAGPYFKELQRRLTPKGLEQFKMSRELEDLEVEDIDTGGRILSLVLQQITCRRFDQARETIRRLWPQGDESNLIRKIKDIAKRWTCDECKKAIEAWR